MRLGVLFLPNAPGAPALARRLEDVGVDSLWVPELWGYDALTGIAHTAAHTSSIGLGTFVVQLGGRSPALLGGSALSLQQLSGGRFEPLRVGQGAVQHRSVGPRQGGEQRVLCGQQAARLQRLVVEPGQGAICPPHGGADTGDRALG